MDLLDKKILVTGGTAGIGKATAQMLIEAGAKVAITGRDTEKLNRVAIEIGAVPIALDQSVYKDIPGRFQETVEALGGLDTLINNAGIGSFAGIEGLKAEDFDRVFSVNVIGLAMLTQEAVRVFQAQSSGHIINIGSTASLNGFPGGSVYCASKFALRAMTLCWQKELRKHNIRVIQVNPSEVPTAFGSPTREERASQPSKLTPIEIAHAITSTLKMDDRGFIPELSVWATNP